MIKYDNLMAGIFHVEVVKSGDIIKRAKFQNLIVDSGLNYAIKSNQWCYGCEVGTGTSEPLPTDGALEIPLAIAWNINYSSASRKPNVHLERPYVGITKTYTFNVGAVVGNISEIAIWQHAGSYKKGSMFSRALIKDEAGNPTTITVLADEQLIVTYEHRHYINMESRTGTFELTGSLAGTYEYESGPYGLTNDNRYDSANALKSMTSTNNSGFPNHDWPKGVANVDGTGLLDPFNAGSTPRQNTPTTIGGGDNSDTIGEPRHRFRVFYDTDRGNVPGGINWMAFMLGRIPQQFRISPPIMKDKDSRLTLEFEVSWGRYEGEL